jgi:hypothetical protein
MNFTGLTVLIGLIFGIFLTAVLFLAVHTDGKLKGKFDEKQTLARGRSYTYAFYTTVAANLIMMILYALNIPVPFEPYIAFFIALIPSAFVQGFFAIWNDAGEGLNTKKNSSFKLYIVIGTVNLLLAVFFIATGMMYVDGKFTIGFVALLCGIMMFFMLVVTCIRERIRAKEEEED